MWVRRRNCSPCFWSDKAGLPQAKTINWWIVKSESDCQKVYAFRSSAGKAATRFVSFWVSNFCTWDTSLNFSGCSSMVLCCKIISLWAVHVWSACSVFGLHHAMHMHFKKQMFSKFEFGHARRGINSQEAEKMRERDNQLWILGLWPDGIKVCCYSRIPKIKLTVLPTFSDNQHLVESGAQKEYTACCWRVGYTHRPKQMLCRNFKFLAPAIVRR